MNRTRACAIVCVLSALASGCCGSLDHEVGDAGTLPAEVQAQVDGYDQYAKSQTANAQR
jgi:hypothetical protein